MPKIVYTPKDFNAQSLDTIEKVNAILEHYVAQGFDLTLRQTFYQFVSRGLIANSEREYDWLGGLVSDA